MYNGVNYYAPFYGKELADLILDGDPVMLQIQKSYQDVKNLVRCLPKNTRINGAIQQLSMHLRVGALIAETVRFQSVVGDTSPVSQLPFPVNTGVFAEPVVCKRKSATTTTDTQEKSAQPLAQPAATGPTAAKVAKVSVTSPIGLDRTDIDLLPNQCHCGEAYADAVALKGISRLCARMITGRVQENGCGMTGLSPGVHKCVKTNLLSGSISAPNIQIGTSITVLLKIVSGALMRYQPSPTRKKVS